MTRYKIIVSKWLILLLISGLSFDCQGQTSYKCYIKNIHAMSAKVIQFDVWIESTGGSNLRLQGFQGGININNFKSFANGGHVTGSFLAGSADKHLPPKQQAPNWSFDTVSQQIHMFAEILISNSAATVIPSADGKGIKIGTCQLTNTTDFNGLPDLSWIFGSRGTARTNTVILCYVNNDIKGTDVTNAAYHSVMK